jgi:hypothetical protein
MINLEPEEHASLSPSSAHRWINCPGSIRLCADLDSASSSFAEEGTFAHVVAAACLEQHQQALEFLGETDGKHEVNVEMADYLQLYLDVVHSIEGPTAIETRVYTNHREVHGTADAIVDGGDDLHVIDLKYGAGIWVEVEENPQLMIYALGALNETDAEYEKVTMHVVQPRHSDPIHRSFTMTVEELVFWDDNVLTPAVRNTKRSDAKLSAGDHCRFCDAKPHCPALRAVVQAKTREVFATGKPPDPRTLTADQIGEILQVAPLIELWLKSVREHAYSKLQSGQAIPGYKLIGRNSPRKWLDESLARAAGVPTKPVSPAQAEKEIDPEIVAELVAPVRKCAVLVHESDKRQALPLGSPFEKVK